MCAAGLAAPEPYLVHQSFRVEGGRAALEQLLQLDELPRAVLATNNLSGVGVLEAINDRGLENELSVGVIGELPFVVSPPNHVFNVPLNPRAMGVTAARMLLERINGLDLPPRLVVLRGSAGVPMDSAVLV